MAARVPDQAAVQEGLAEVGEARLWYWDTGGEGTPVVLCHPASQSAAVWVYQQPVLRAAGYRVIGYDRRGYGRSEKGADARPGTSAGDLGALLDHLGVARAHVIGAAAGGITALAFAVAAPGRVATVTLAGTIFSPNEADWREAYGRLGIDRVREHVAVEFLELGPSYRFRNPEGTARFAALSADAHRQAPVRQASGVDVSWARMAAMRQPVLLVTGDADLYAPPPLQAMVGAHFADAEAHVLAEVGHAAYWEAPAAFNALVLGFLGRRGLG